jgi:hypothetical protein
VYVHCHIAPCSGFAPTSSLRTTSPNWRNIALTPKPGSVAISRSEDGLFTTVISGLPVNRPIDYFRRADHLRLQGLGIPPAIGLLTGLLPNTQKPRPA